MSANEELEMQGFRVLFIDLESYHEAGDVFENTRKRARSKGAHSTNQVPYLARKKGWTQSHQAKLDELWQHVLMDEFILGWPDDEIGAMEKKRNAALRLRDTRKQIELFMKPLSDLESQSAEGLAQQEQFEFLVARSLVSAVTGQPVYKSPDEYRASAESALGLNAAREVARIYFDWNEPPEEVFLREHAVAA